MYDFRKKVKYYDPTLQPFDIDHPLLYTTIDF